MLDPVAVFRFPSSLADSCDSLASRSVNLRQKPQLRRHPRCKTQQCAGKQCRLMQCTMHEQNTLSHLLNGLRRRSLRLIASGTPRAAPPSLATLSRWLLETAVGLAACELGGARWLVDLAVTRWRGMVPVAYLSFWLLCSGSFSSNFFLYLYRSRLGSRLTAAEG